MSAFGVGADDIAGQLADLRPGDRVRLTFAPLSASSPPDTRSVTVTSRTEWAIYTTSGRQRPGQVAGGVIYLVGGWRGWPTYHPTMHQTKRTLLAVEVAQ